jgi:hypothetical protein
VDLLVEICERVAELCSKFVRAHGIEFLENRCLVLKCAAMRGVLMKNDMFLDWTILKACLKDQQVLPCIDMKLCDNEENNLDRDYEFST